MWPPERREPGRTPSIVRPYVLTRGRTHAPGPSLALETSIRSVRTDSMLPLGAPPESKRLVSLCQPPVSLAELSARAHLPLGVVRVLVSDLVAAKVLAVDGPRAVDAAHDVPLLERLLDGIRAL